MKELTLKQIADWCGGKVSARFEHLRVSRMQSDSRKVRSGDLFVALKGAKADGHDFAETAINHGAVAALVSRHYGIPAEALSMYRFTELPKPKVFKDGYRELLDNAPMTDEQREALIDECIEGFRINASLFAQLGRKVAEA